MSANECADVPIPLPPPAQHGKLFGLLALIVMYAIPAETITAPLAEYDTGWHLRTGQWIVQHGAVPHLDTFSTVGADKLWVAYSWLFALGLYGLYQSFSLVGILLGRVVLAMAVAVAIYLMVRRRQPVVIAQAGIVVLASIAMAPLLISERPGLFSILFAVWTLEAILALREGNAGWKIWLLPGLYALWANIHIQFVHGLFILGLAWLAYGVDAVLARPRPATFRRDWRRLTILLAACVLATLCNPYHWHLYEVVLTYSRQKETYQLFAELSSLAFRGPADWCVLGLTCAAWFSLGRRKNVDSFEVLLLLAGMYFSFHARHDVWFVVLAACVVLSRARPAARIGALETTPIGVGWVALIAAGVLMVLFVLQGPTEKDLHAKLAKEFPVAAADYVENHNLSGPIFNPIDWGGYLIWRLPQYQVTIDGRAQLHGGPRIRRLMVVCAGAPGWSNDPDLNAAGFVLLQSHAPLAEILRVHPGWRLVHTTDNAVIFVRKSLDINRRD